MVESDGKLTDVNFYQTEKISLWQTDDQTENRAKEKTDPLGRFSCGVEVGFHRNDRLDVRKGRNTAQTPVIGSVHHSHKSFNREKFRHESCLFNAQRFISVSEGAKFGNLGAVIIFVRLSDDHCDSVWGLVHIAHIIVEGYVSFYGFHFHNLRLHFLFSFCLRNNYTPWKRSLQPLPLFFRLTYFIAQALNKIRASILLSSRAVCSSLYSPFWVR